MHHTYDVGSSKNITDGLLISSSATLMRFFWPPDNEPHLVWYRSSKPSNSNVLWIWNASSKANQTPFRNRGPSRSTRRYPCVLHTNFCLYSLVTLNPNLRWAATVIASPTVRYGRSASSWCMYAEMFRKFSELLERFLPLTVILPVTPVSLNRKMTK